MRRLLNAYVISWSILVFAGTVFSGGVSSDAVLPDAVSSNDVSSDVVSSDDAHAADKTIPVAIDPQGIDGTLVICGGGALPDDIVAEFVKHAGGTDARIVVIPTAGTRADQGDTGTLLKNWEARDVAQVELLHTRDREQADAAEFVRPLRDATAVWFSGGSQQRIADAYVGTAVERELAELLKRGGVIGGTSAGAAIMSRLMIASGNPVAKVSRGLGLLPGAVIDQHFRQRNRQPRLQGVISDNPGYVGLGIDEGTAIIARGRRLQVLGKSAVTVCLAGGAERSEKQFLLESGETADLTALRRAAADRTKAPFPTAEVTAPVLANGSLVIVGGGRLPKNLLERFIELAGGPDASIVVIPTAMEDPIRNPDRDVSAFQRAGASNVHVVHARTREEVEGSEFQQRLKSARGVWFGGGRQWRLVDAYAGTRAEQLFREVLSRGGVIGGSSAGASIQAEYLVRGNPLGNREMMSEGYERGFGFLPATAIDQHFSQRRRFADMVALKQRFPQLLGIGIDEQTALVVRGRQAEIVGRNQVRFYPQADANSVDSPEPVVGETGETFDLGVQQVVKPAEDPAEN